MIVASTKSYWMKWIPIIWNADLILLVLTREHGRGIRKSNGQESFTISTLSNSSNISWPWKICSKKLMGNSTGLPSYRGFAGLSKSLLAFTGWRLRERTANSILRSPPFLIIQIVLGRKKLRFKSCWSTGDLSDKNGLWYLLESLPALTG
jgi:hypothetical protein